MDKSGKNYRVVSSGQCDNKNTGNTLTPCFFSLPPRQFSLLSSIIGILLIDNLELDQQNSLGNFIVSIGQAILTAAAQGQSLKSRSQQNDYVRQQIQMLKSQISALEQRLD